MSGGTLALWALWLNYRHLYIAGPRSLPHNVASRSSSSSWPPSYESFTPTVPRGKHPTLPLVSSATPGVLGLSSFDFDDLLA
jgi:hypothetical protein